MKLHNMIKPVKISIIEDNHYLRKGWEAVLGDNPHIELTGSYSSCEEAFALHDNIAGSNFILMDISLPGISGIEGVKYINRNFPETDVIMITVHDDDEYVFNAVCAGAVGYLHKKVTPNELLDAIHTARSGGSPMSPRIARKVIDLMRNPAIDADKVSLSKREKEVLQHMAQGKSYAEISKAMFLSIDGVRYHIRSIYEKLQVHSRAEAVAKVLQNRLLES